MRCCGWPQSCTTSGSTGCPSDRPYRAARSPEDAICELRRCAGHQFDPNVVDLLCEVLAAEEEPAAKLAARG